MKLVFTSEERKQDFYKAIKYLAYNNSYIKASLENMLDTLEMEVDRKRANVTLERLFGALNMAAGFMRNSDHTLEEFRLVNNAVDALIWSDFE